MVNIHSTQIAYQLPLSYPIHVRLVEARVTGAVVATALLLMAVAWVLLLLLLAAEHLLEEAAKLGAHGGGLEDQENRGEEEVEGAHFGGCLMAFTFFQLVV